MEPTIFEPRVKFKPMLKFFKFGLWNTIFICNSNKMFNLEYTAKKKIIQKRCRSKRHNLSLYTVQLCTNPKYFISLYFKLTLKKSIKCCHTLRFVHPMV